MVIRRKVQQQLQGVYNFPNGMRKWFKWKYGQILLTLKAIFYNEFMNSSYASEVVMEPMVWVVDHFSKALGPVSIVNANCYCHSVLLLSSVHCHSHCNYDYHCLYHCIPRRMP
ncbi:uncharacterized protein LOC134767480 [Penaeus indicus]|uniref:uncharacterized protein LOC134767480 n=1 Tax=Penaeus indicus TaxID=29960 RepID=UPI00300C268F